MKIGITGGIGAGKSFVCDILRGWDYPVYDCDSAAKRLMVESPEVRRAIAGVVGPGAYTADGQLDRTVVAAYLFAASEHVSAINSIVHPAVREDFLQWAADKPVCFMESAILFESGFDVLVDRCIQVTAPLDVRIRRAMQRDETSEQKVRARMAVQMSEENVGRHSHFVIVNDGDRDLDGQIRAMLKQIE